MNIGFVGLGTMGAAMVPRLLDAGFQVCVHNRTRAREEALAARGASRAATPAEAAAHAEVVIVMVSDTPDVEAVVFGEHGVANTLAAGALLIDMSTIAPGASARDPCSPPSVPPSPTSGR